MIPFLASHMFQNQSNWNRSDDTNPIKSKNYLKVLKYKPMFLKLKVSNAYDYEMKERLINVSMIKEVTPGTSDMKKVGLKEGTWCYINFIDDNGIYAQIGMNSLLCEINSQK